MSILAAIAVLAILIVVHELGHFSAARLQGIHVNRFSIGFGPALLKYQGKKTEYAIRAIPLGGYVGFPDDDPESTIASDDPNLMRNRPVIDRAIVISAGVIANLIFAYFLLVVQSGIIGFHDVNYQPGVLIPEVLSQEESVAARAGVQPGDIVLAIDSQTLPASKNAMLSLRKRIENSANEPLNLTIKRGESTISLVVTPELGKEGAGRIGVMLAANGEVIQRRANNIFQAFGLAEKEFQRLASLTSKGFGQLITNFKETSTQVAGPVAIVAVGAQLAQDNLANLLQFGALISINLAIINILPLPALDGGQLAFLLMEALLGKPLPTKLQDGIMQTGLVLLLGLGVILIVRDTANLAFFQQLLQ
jgi:membrane-associated protease RseP (regulator of RpoE activity)